MVSAMELGQRPLDRLSLARADDVLETGGLLITLLDLAKRLGEPVWFRPWLEADDGEDGLATLLARWESVRNEALPSQQSIKLIKEVQSQPGPQ